MKSKLLTVVVFTFSLLAKGAYAQNQYYLPHFVNGNFGLTYKTSFILFNNSDATVAATLRLTDDNGSPLTANISGLGSGSQFPIALDAGTTKMYQTDGLGSSQGAATVTASAPIGVSAIFTVHDSGNFVSESGVGASGLTTDFMLPVDSTGSALTGLALFNPGTTDAALTLTLIKPDGSTGSTQAVPLKSGNHLAAFVALNSPGQFFPTLSSFRGTLRVQTTASIAAMVLRMYQTPSATTFTSLPVVSRSSTRSALNLAHVANGSYGSISFKTSFLIFNISSSPANVMLVLTDDKGSPLTVTMQGLGAGVVTNSSFSIPLAAAGSVFLQTDGSGAGSQGAASITSNSPVGASAIFTVLGPQNQFQSEAGVGDSPPLTALTLPVDVTGSSDTGVAFFNPGSTSVDLRFRLLDLTGIVVGTTTKSVAAKGHFAGFVDNPLFPGTSNFRGSLAVSSTGGISSTVLRQYDNTAAQKVTYTTLPTASGTATGKSAPSPPTISTVVGNGTEGLSGDGGPATAAQLRYPFHMVTDTAGNLFIADTGSNRIRKVTPAGVISTIAGIGSISIGSGGDGGPATSAELATPESVAVDAAGNVYIADYDNSRVRKVTLNGTIQTVAGNGYWGFGGDGGPATSARIPHPAGIAVDTSGNLYIADESNNRIRMVTPAGMISTVAGNGGYEYFGGDGGPATSAQLYHPRGVAVDPEGNLFISDSGNSRIRKVTPAGVISTVAGNGIEGYSGDGGPATAAQLKWPNGITVDTAGNLFIADTRDHRIRKVTPAGVISTIAGNGMAAYEGDGGPATSAKLGTPYGVAVDSAGNLFIADTYNHRIRSVAGAGGSVTMDVTLSGEGGAAGLTPVTQINVVLNWFEELKRLVPAGMK
jgi:sugar lactone lactonase YvrE